VARPAADAMPRTAEPVMSHHEIFESIMLLCFSCSWYFSIFRMLRVRRASGKSAQFVVLICTGYVFGLAAKLVLHDQTGELSPVFWLYLWNLGVTLFDLYLVLHFSRQERLEEGTIEAVGQSGVTRLAPASVRRR
jgi:hypothetical protein